MKRFLIWKPRITPANRLLFQLVPSMHLTGGIGSSLLPTPVTQEGPGGKDVVKLTDVIEGKKILTYHRKDDWHEIATRFCRMDDGIPNRVDRFRALGNAIVPQVVIPIMQIIKYIDDNELYEKLQNLNDIITIQSFINNNRGA